MISGKLGSVNLQDRELRVQSFQCSWFILVVKCLKAEEESEEDEEEAAEEAEEEEEEPSSPPSSSSFAPPCFSASAMAITRVFDSGQRRLHELGYKQELKRELTAIATFAITSAYLSILTGVTTLYSTGLSYGGPISMIYGWIIAGVFTMFVALSMAEICSVYPTSGGLYFWSYKLAGKEWGPFASWITGW